MRKYSLKTNIDINSKSPFSYKIKDSMNLKGNSPNKFIGNEMELILKLYMSFSA